MTHDIVFVHLLNDFSGSPKILRDTIRAASARHWRAKLYVGSSGQGFLSNCGVPTTRYSYRRTGWRIGTLFSYLWSQLVLFVRLLGDRSIERNAIVYVNTLLPFAASLYGKLTGRKVICHIHEIALSPPLLRHMLVAVAHAACSLNVFVSDAHMQSLAIHGPRARRIHDSLEDEFLAKARVSQYEHLRHGCFNVLMIGSLRDYKGIPELVELAASLIDEEPIRFHLLVNEDRAAIDRYFSGRPVPRNLSLHPRTSETPKFYERASLVLNLSRVDQWVETFGLTILEAMAFGIPVIVPPVGGPPELVTDGVQGFLVDSRDRALLRERVWQLYRDPSTCLRMSQAGRERASHFSPTRFADEIVSTIDAVRSDAA